jgi:UDP-N-acetylmuramyl tripeptide synthase
VFEESDSLMLKLKHFFFEGRGSAGKTFAVGAAILGLISVVAADMMSRMVEKGAPLTIVITRSGQNLKRLASAAAAGEPNSVVTKVVGNVGVDMSPTAAIPSLMSASRCDDTSQAVLMTRSIGMEGTTTTPIATPEPPCN